MCFGGVWAPLGVLLPLWRPCRWCLCPPYLPALHHKQHLSCCLARIRSNTCVLIVCFWLKQRASHVSYLFLVAWLGWHTSGWGCAVYVWAYGTGSGEDGYGIGGSQMGESLVAVLMLHGCMATVHTLTRQHATWLCCGAGCWHAWLLLLGCAARPQGQWWQLSGQAAAQV